MDTVGWQLNLSCGSIYHGVCAVRSNVRSSGPLRPSVAAKDARKAWIANLDVILGSLQRLVERLKPSNPRYVSGRLFHNRQYE